MSDFRRVSDTFWASPQIALADVETARAQGFAHIVNNRPEGEVAEQPEGSAVEQAAQAAGMTYTAIPVEPGGFTMAQVDALVDCLKGARGPVLAYCRSGTRSTLLWALAQAKLGRDHDAIAGEAAAAGYDIGPVRPLMDQVTPRH